MTQLGKLLTSVIDSTADTVIEDVTDWAVEDIDACRKVFHSFGLVRWNDRLVMKVRL